MVDHPRQSRPAGAALCAGALIAGLLLGDFAGAPFATLPLWAGGLGALAGLWAGLRSLSADTGAAGRLTEAVLLSALLLLGVGRGAQGAHGAAVQLAQGAACEGEAWVRGSLGVESGRCVLTVHALRSTQAGAARALAEPLRVALSGAPHESLRRAAHGRGTLEGLLRLRSPRGPSGPGAADERAIARAARYGATGALILGHLELPPARGGRPASAARREAFWDASATLGSRLRARISRSIGGDPGAFAACFLLGQAQDARVPPGYAFALWRCGASHLLAVSGLHIGMVAALIHILLGVLPWSPRVRWCGLAIALGLYATAVGPSVSVARAATVGALWALLRAAGRMPRPRTLLLVVGATWLWAAPGSGRLPGWRLTYLVSLTLVGIASGRGSRAGRTPRPRSGLARAVLRGLAAAGTAIVAAQGAAWPLVLGHYGWASPFFVLSNALLIPLCGLLMPLLWVALAPLAAPGFPGDLAGGPAALAIRGFVALAGTLGRLCDAWVVGCGPPQEAALAISLAVAVVCNLARWSRGSRLALAVFLAGIFSVWALAREPESSLLAVDVGQGECWVLAWPGETWVLDTGPEPATAGRARWALARALRRLGRGRIDRLMLTHTDGDHTGGLREILAAGMPVGVLHHPAGWRPEGWLAEALATLARDGTRLEPLAAGDSLSAPGARAVVIHPPAGALAGGAGDNEGSLALRVAAGGLVALLSGDVPAREQLGWVRAGLDLTARVLSGAHHGSRGSTPDELLAATGARLLVISAGRGNRFGHPHAEVLERAARRGVIVLRTDRDGSILLGHWRRGWTARAWIDGRTLPL